MKSNETSSLSGNGFSNWRKLSEILKSHEESPRHKENYKTWVETELRFTNKKTIDQQAQNLILSEMNRWKSVLERLISIVLYLAENNLAFRGKSDKLYTPRNGKFLGLVQLLAKYDPVMQEHVRLALNDEIATHYCSKTIQNELINLISNEVTLKIVQSLKIAKKIDCTPDISHLEQLSLTLRYLEFVDNDVKIQERFLGYLSVNDSTGKGLSDLIHGTLEKFEIKLIDCRGQGYDNGANMKGKHSGVQKRILDSNPLAHYVPCGCHSLNLVLCDAARSSLKSVTMFGVIQRLYTLFSASVKRWDILTDHVKDLTLKEHGDTRWESRIESVKAVRYQISGIHDALLTLAEKTKKTDPAISNEAESLIDHISKFDFLVSLTVRCSFSSKYYQQNITIS